MLSTLRPNCLRKDVLNLRNRSSIARGCDFIKIVILSKFAARAVDFPSLSHGFNDDIFQRRYSVIARDGIALYRYVLIVALSPPIFSSNRDADKYRLLHDTREMHEFSVRARSIMRFGFPLVVVEPLVPSVPKSTLGSIRPYQPSETALARAFDLSCLGFPHGFIDRPLAFRFDAGVAMYANTYARTYTQIQLRPRFA